MNLLKKLLILSCFSIAAISSNAQAAILVDNSNPDFSYPFQTISSVNQVVLSSFELANDSVIEQFNWWGESSGIDRWRLRIVNAKENIKGKLVTDGLFAKEVFWGTSPYLQQYTPTGSAITSMFSYVLETPIMLEGNTKYFVSIEALKDGYWGWSVATENDPDELSLVRNRVAKTTSRENFAPAYQLIGHETPVPEPTTMALGFMGISGLALVRRKKK